MVRQAHEIRSRNTFPETGKLLALDIRARKAGFVVMETASRLIDWGVRTYSTGAKERALSAGTRIESLLDFHSPGTILLRQTRVVNREAQVVVTQITRRLRRIATKRLIRFAIVHPREIKELFGRYGCRNKYEVAKMLADTFDEISWKMPKRRKPWQSEGFNQTLFDALAAAMTHLASESR